MSWRTSGLRCGCARGYAGPRLAALWSFRRAGVEESKVRFKVKKEGRKGKVPLYWHVVWMVEVETRIPGG